MENYERIGDRIPTKEIWQRLIVKWRILMDDYIKNYYAEERDVPYWHDEYTNGGFLAGAVWSLGGSVVEQLGVERVSVTNKSKGRCDFWIGIDGLKCFIEAKKMKPPALSEKTIPQIKNVLGEARLQLEKIEDRKDIGIAICFVIPEIKSTYISAFNETRRIFDEAIDCFKGDNNIIATYFPQDNVQPESDGYYYPGVAIVGELLT